MGIRRRKRNLRRMGQVRKSPREKGGGGIEINERKPPERKGSRTISSIKIRNRLQIRKQRVKQQIQRERSKQSKRALAIVVVKSRINRTIVDKKRKSRKNQSRAIRKRNKSKRKIRSLRAGTTARGG